MNVLIADIEYQFKIQNLDTGSALGFRQGGTSNFSDSLQEEFLNKLQEIILL